MMKKLLVLMLVLGISSVASAGTVDLVISSWGAGPDPITEPIPPVTEITIGPSEWVDLDVMYTASADWLLASISIDLVLTGNATLYVDDLTEPPGAWDSDLTVITENVAGKHYTLEFSMDSGLAGIVEPTIALDHILVHCDDLGDVTLVMSDNSDTGTGGTVETDWSAMPTPTFGITQVSITQVPEPMTLALLGLGGLFLVRRKK
jgi:hypothetical protein